MCASLEVACGRALAAPTITEIESRAEYHPFVEARLYAALLSGFRARLDLELCDEVTLANGELYLTEENQPLPYTKHY